MTEYQKDTKNVEPNDGAPLQFPGTGIVHGCTFRSLHHSGKLASIKPHHTVELRLGPEQIIDSATGKIPARATWPKGNIPGTDIPWAPIHVLRQLDFHDLHEVTGLSALVAERAGGALAAVLDLSFQLPDGSKGAIEVPIAVEKGENLPSQLTLSGEQLKELFVTIVHEAAHMAGYDEFMCYLIEQRYAYSIGHRETAPDPLEIMQHVLEMYDSGARNRSENEFLTYCEELGDEGHRLKVEYYKFADELLERQDARFMEELDEFDPDGGLRNYRFPIAQKNVDKAA